jgi:hypothetical protein
VLIVGVSKNIAVISTPTVGRDVNSTSAQPAPIRISPKWEHFYLAKARPQLQHTCASSLERGEEVCHQHSTSIPHSRALTVYGSQCRDFPTSADVSREVQLNRIERIHQHCRSKVQQERLQPHLVAIPAKRVRMSIQETST